MNKRTNRQAVVLIHGIGEQRPMGTIRPFVKAVAGTDGDNGAYYSKPDAMSSLFELRKLQGRGSPSTDYYEYYWAYNIEGTKLWDVAKWLWQLIRRPRRDVPDGLGGLWFTSRLLLFAVVVLLIGGVFGPAMRQWAELPKFGLAWLAGTVVIGIVQFVMVSYLGDAARYLSPRPQNIKLRQVIRSEGITLLKTLHESGKYDRIILVGHSLGSVIGYDLLTHLWQVYNQKLPSMKDDAKVKQTMGGRICANATPQPIVRDALSKIGEAVAAGGKPELLSDFQKRQKQAWCEQRYYGNPWLITDFVTLGSPLAHAMLLLADGKVDFDDRKAQRELVTCPPVKDEMGYGYWQKMAIDIGAQPGKKAALRYNPLILHHAAPFAVTRWTNLYFPVRFGLFGDAVGGPLGPVLGGGIRDIEVSTRRWKGWAGHTLSAHTSYWLGCDAQAAADASARPPSLHALKRALLLDELRSFVGKPPKPPAALQAAQAVPAGGQPNTPATNPVPPDGKEPVGP
ncbi:MAG: hypothetical protein ABWZ83_09415 [Mesorhizobium sp.]